MCGIVRGLAERTDRFSEQVVPAAQALRDDPARALSADQARAELKRSRARRG